MEFTGERYVPSETGQIRHEHMHRYAWCRPLVDGKAVLDIACGEGYGSAMMAKRAARVIGVDISHEVVEHARKTYGEAGNLEFIQGDAAVIPLPDASVDVVVSFETIEHHDHHEEMLSEIRRVLRPDGVLIISSPNRVVYSEQAGYHNEYHVKELDLAEFDEVLRRQFENVRYYGQRLAVGSALFRLQPEKDSLTVNALTDLGTDIVERATQLVDPVYFVAIATAAGTALPDVPSSVLFSEAEDLYTHHREVAAWAQRLDVEHVKALEHIAFLTKAHQEAQDETTAIRHESEQIRLEFARNTQILQGELLGAREQIVERNVRIGQLEQDLVNLHSGLAEAREHIAEREGYIQQLEHDRAQLAVVISSRSWRLTRPLRFLARVIRHRTF